MTVSAVMLNSPSELAPGPVVPGTTSAAVAGTDRPTRASTHKVDVIDFIFTDDEFELKLGVTLTPPEQDAGKSQQ